MDPDLPTSYPYHSPRTSLPTSPSPPLLLISLSLSLSLSWVLKSSPLVTPAETVSPLRLFVEQGSITPLVSNRTRARCVVV
ncbi:hypothetical protein M408DRAFT_147904 [Serendipita vermifera MAFF 305830]|uniref:Uncharacterized protein n=1 Tax=Serendipita vermifera MAFF 305830 TaxID=933852 RepID=A0A0C2XGA1_SERVB|nr:hypothetical protein M408DRAFT_147904 [Serendipita vermifera MAFF 305830]